ncbi:MAG: DeoR/GlpR transcriptional regulator [Alistipes sp.]|nr:DeoR/GlpR transcriptional regulator [Candidatus Alistipes equi]
MNATETRRSKIIRKVKALGFVSVSALSEELKVTSATIRSDLNALEQEHIVIRSHGGAIPASSPVTNLREDEKAKRNMDLKLRIAAEATKLVKSDDSITIACGSTMLAFANALNPQGTLNVLTPSIRIALSLVENPNVNVFQLGGMIDSFTYSSHGQYAEKGIEMFHSNKLFFGVEGFDTKVGLSCATIAEADITKKMIQAATQIVVLADSTKFRRRGFCNICSMKDIDILITDDGLDEKAREEIQSLGIKLIIA